MAEQLPMVRMSLLIGQRSAIAISKYKHNPGILTGKERQTAGRDMEKENVILELRGIKKSFGEVHALKNANFSLRKGEIHSINLHLSQLLQAVSAPLYSPLYVTYPPPIKGHSSP